MRKRPARDTEAAATEPSWRTCLIGHMVRHFPDTAPPVERRLVRTAYTIHRMADAIGAEPSNSDIWRFADVLQALDATAAEARAAGMSELYVSAITEMTRATACEVLDIALRYMSPAERAKLRS